MGARAWFVWLALVVATAGCEKILGIHDSHLRDGGADARGAAGSAGAPPSDGGAGAGGAVAGSGGASAAGTGGGSGGSAGAGGRGGIGAAGAAPDAGPARDAMTDASEVGDVSPPQDVAPEAPPKCPSSSSVQTVKMLEFSAGPHGADKNPGACEYPLSVLLPTAASHFYAAAPSSLLGNGQACGACLLVSNLLGTVNVEVQIIDNSGTAAINIDHEAYKQIDSTFNNPMVNVRFVTCDYDGTTIQAQFRGAGDPAVLLYGFRTRPAKVEILGAGNATTVLHQLMNYWELTGPAPGGTTARLRLTDELGAEVTTDPLPIDGVFHDTGKQFPICAP